LDGVAAIQCRQAATDLRMEFRQLGGAGLVVLFEEPQGFADDLTCRVVAAGLWR
jgi:hypothetical protein